MSGTLPSSASSITPSSIGAERARFWSADALVAATATSATAASMTVRRRFTLPPSCPGARRGASARAACAGRRRDRCAAPSRAARGARDVGAALLGIVRGSASNTMRLSDAVRADHLLGQFQQRELLRVADVDGEMLVGFGEPRGCLDQVVDVAERAGLAAVAEDRDRLAGERLPHERGDRAAVVRRACAARRC